jgi:hypothetical protein
MQPHQEASHPNGEALAFVSWVLGLQCNTPLHVSTAALLTEGCTACCWMQKPSCAAVLLLLLLLTVMMALITTLAAV